MTLPRSMLGLRLALATGAWGRKRRGPGGGSPVVELGTRCTMCTSGGHLGFGGDARCKRPRVQASPGSSAAGPRPLLPKGAYMQLVARLASLCRDSKAQRAGTGTGVISCPMYTTPHAGRPLPLSM